MFISIGIILTVGFLGGYLFEKIKLPKLVFYLILGILLGPSLLNLLDSDLLNISSYLRQIALIIILTRSGLSLDLKTLKSLGRPALLMCFLPASFEILGIAIFGPLLLNISIFEALVLGAVLAAVSPAVVVPRMIKIMDSGYGAKNNAPTLILAGSSVDDIFVIVLFYSFKGLVTSNELNILGLLNIPISIILGVILGLLAGFVLIKSFKLFKMNYIIKTIFMLGISFLMLGLETILKDYLSISSLLGIITMGAIVLFFDKPSALELKNTYNGLWNVFEILLFVLVGAATNISYAISENGAIILGLILIALVFRIIGVLVSISFTKFDIKEKIFIAISYIPKATVQASIGAICLEEGLACGDIVLTGAVISILLTAPIGAILIDNLYKHLLKIGETQENVSKISEN